MRWEFEVTRSQLTVWMLTIQRIKMPGAFILGFVEKQLKKFLDSNTYPKFRIIVEADEEEKERIGSHVPEDARRA